MRIIRSADYRQQAWKNGGGRTIEIAAHPAGAGLDAFEWRFSMALIERPGPFSRFAGIDRTLMVLEGAGLALHFRDRGIVRLERASPACAFPGEAAVEATLAAGPVRDLNLMSRRARWRHALSHVTAISAFRLVRHGAVTLALCRGGSASCAPAGRLEEGDTLVLAAEAAPAAIDLAIDGTADLYIADLWPLPPGP